MCVVLPARVPHSPCPCNVRWAFVCVLPSHTPLAQVPPIDALIKAARSDQHYETPPFVPFSVPELGFPHQACVLGHDVHTTRAHSAPEDLLAAYQNMLRIVRCDSGGSHNVLLTPSWMMVVPRTSATWEGTAINALAFAGLLTVNQEQEQRLQEVTPLGVLRHLAEGSSVAPSGAWVTTPPAKTPVPPLRGDVDSPGAGAGAGAGSGSGSGSGSGTGFGSGSGVGSDGGAVKADLDGMGQFAAEAALQAVKQEAERQAEAASRGSPSPPRGSTTRYSGVGAGGSAPIAGSSARGSPSPPRSGTTRYSGVGAGGSVSGAPPREVVAADVVAAAPPSDSAGASASAGSGAAFGSGVGVGVGSGSGSGAAGIGARQSVGAPGPGFAAGTIAGSGSGFGSGSGSAPPVGDSAGVSVGTGSGSASTTDSGTSMPSGSHHSKHSSLLDMRATLLATPKPNESTVKLQSGRVVPGTLLAGTEMIAVSHPTVMRLLIRNQGSITKLFRHYARADEEMTRQEFVQLAKDFNVVPTVCSMVQLLDVFELVNVSEAADDNVTELDSEEFSESLTRLAIYYFPGSFNLHNSDDLVAAVEALLMHMSESPKAQALKITFQRAKRRR